MNDDLFSDMKESLSPKMRWMRQHKIVTQHHCDPEIKGNDWTAHHPSGTHTVGNEEDEALCKLINKVDGLQHWNLR